MVSGKSSRTIMIVDDETATLRTMKLSLRTRGFENVETCGDPKQALAMIREKKPQMLLLDLIMPGMNGEDVLDQVRNEVPDLPVVVFTAEYDARVAVRCMKRGATDYLLKPVTEELLFRTVEQTLERVALRDEAAALRDQFFENKIQNPEAFADIITSDGNMLRVFAYLEAVAGGSHPVLICGETGTGKELVANALHRLSGREGEFVAVNVAGLDDTMFSDTLFGHKPGAYTGAEGSRRGMIEAAGDGTLFLDEIGDLSTASQVKLLRLIQEREYYPLGSDVSQTLRSRVVAATNQDPSTLRADLYYRLRTYQVRIPPLRDRLCDLRLLVPHFVEKAASDLDREPPGVPPELYLYLSNYSFPGNIRELQAMVFDAVARSEPPVLSMTPFLEHIRDRKDEGTGDREPGEIRFGFPMPLLRQIEAAAVLEAMNRLEGNQTAVAEMLGISRPTVARHLKRTKGDAGA